MKSFRNMAIFANTREAEAIRDNRFLSRNALTKGHRAFIALCLESCGHARRHGDKARACELLEAVYREQLGWLNTRT